MKHLIGISLLLIAFSAYTWGQTEEELKQEIVIETSLGNIEVLLYDDTPLHRDNMIKLINDGFYKNHLFHRVINDFMIQGGDPNSVNAVQGVQLGNGGPGYQIPAEIRQNRFHKKGVLAAARMGDNFNPERKSSGSQFYIVEGQKYTRASLAQYQSARNLLPFTKEQITAYTTVGGTPHLDGAYTVFGEVTKGVEVIEAISDVETDGADRPITDVVFNIRLK
ncbi:peptidylprolyl isomerase [Bacteroidota bacterium]